MSEPEQDKRAEDPDASGSVPDAPVPVAPKRDNHFVAILGTSFKLFKSGAALKVVLAGSAFAGWSLLFSWQLALIVLGTIIFHEYGHVVAMKRCGIPTKGIYLIPFFGGVAVGDKARTYWQEVYISMMGPVFGMAMSVAFWLLFMATDVKLFGLVATFAALVNLFNLLPIYPLDGGHVIKAIVLSANQRYSWLVLIAISAAGFALSVAAGIYLLSFFFVLGAIDLISAQSTMRDATVVQMKPYGMVVSFAWLLGVVAVLTGIVIHMATTGIDGAHIPLVVLQD